MPSVLRLSASQKMISPLIFSGKPGKMSTSDLGVSIDSTCSLSDFVCCRKFESLVSVIGSAPVPYPYSTPDQLVGTL